MTSSLESTLANRLVAWSRVPLPIRHHPAHRSEGPGLLVGNLSILHEPLWVFAAAGGACRSVAPSPQRTVNDALGTPVILFNYAATRPV